MTHLSVVVIFRCVFSRRRQLSGKRQKNEIPPVDRPETIGTNVYTMSKITHNCSVVGIIAKIIIMIVLSPRAFYVGGIEDGARLPLIWTKGDKSPWTNGTAVTIIIR